MFAAAVPVDVDPNVGMLDVIVQLEGLARRYVWGQFGADMPVDIEFAVTEWLVTDKREEVEVFQPAHDCAACRAGNDKADAFLREHPGRWIALGNLFYVEVWE